MSVSGLILPAAYFGLGCYPRLFELNNSIREPRKTGRSRFCDVSGVNLPPARAFWPSVFSWTDSTMTNKSLIRTIPLLFSLASLPAIAVEAPKPVISLFDDGIQQYTAGLDLATAPGMEALGLTALNTSNLTVNDPDERKSKLKVRLKVKNSGTNGLLGDFVPLVETRSYPDTQSAVGLQTSYWSEEDGAVWQVDPAQEGFPCDFELGIGIANSARTAISYWASPYSPGTTISRKAP